MSESAAFAVLPCQSNGYTVAENGGVGQRFGVSPINSEWLLDGFTSLLEILLQAIDGMETIWSCQ